MRGTAGRPSPWSACPSGPGRSAGIGPRRQGRHRRPLPGRVAEGAPTPADRLHRPRRDRARPGRC
eukprot:4445327-Alexandrium_andersonii.AAC.1